MHASSRLAIILHEHARVRFGDHGAVARALDADLDAAKRALAARAR